MLQTWLQWLEVARLADSAADFAGEVAVANAADAVQVTVRFSRVNSWAVAELSVSGEIAATCQRCLRPMRQGVSSSARVVLLADESQADHAPPEYEPIYVPQGRIRICDLIEEEVRLALPIVSMHDDMTQCVTTDAIEKKSPELQTHKPFAQLGDLLKNAN
jgi:uncharacterized metal-binding protein YceD (DUF177 family)